ncbi:hypothetical protein BTA51_17065 [Hahella sp. CCB-MM4]|uniref:hypothetical protein n=1 Tax=Hahella sp. (strain CCB-MM4) TaxID=1926491 RepID=UPI000B9BBF68|nr:hypothetical protein [Hahella sp. CCB-MM4]OZG72205.1 hypothetical protein BTA51_17065 [Hahella sp. CCB-MM4]
MNEPALFIDIEASSPDEDGYPICIAWSTEDGVINTALIIPEDDWVDWDFSYQHSHGLSREHLFDQGDTALDVVKALTQDLGDCTVYVDGLDLDEDWLIRLFDSFEMELPFNIQPFTRFPPGLGFEQFLLYREELLQDHGLSGFNAENNVYVMLQIANQCQTLE